MDRLLEDFFTALRESGVRISVAESIDAANTVKLLGYRDREALKYSLSAALAKSISEKEIFSQCFDLFFSLAAFSIPGDDFSAVLKEGICQEISPLAQMLLNGDNLGLMASLREAAQAVNISEMKLITQQGTYIRKIMDHMGFEELDRDIQRLFQGNKPGVQRMASALEKSRHNLLNYINDFVEQQYSLFTSSRMRGILENHLKNTRFSEIDQRHAEEMRKIIQKLAKRLYALHSRRLKSHKRGGLDLRKTLRKNSAYQGFLFFPQWKAKKIDRPEVFVICDVSRSVRNVAHFMLLFLYSLNKTLSKVRSFILCSNLVEVSHLFEKYPGDKALEKIYKGDELNIVLGPTDYGQAFLDFKEIGLNAVTNKTTVIILGDARNNGGDPQTGIVKQIYRKCKKLIWLNPEYPGIWTMGDSEMNKYLPYCHIAEECNTLNHLYRVLDRLLRS